jgi:hypothetical protein
MPAIGNAAEEMLLVGAVDKSVFETSRKIGRSIEKPTCATKQGE